MASEELKDEVCGEGEKNIGAAILRLEFHYETADGSGLIKKEMMLHLQVKKGDSRIDVITALEAAFRKSLDTIDLPT